MPDDIYKYCLVAEGLKKNWSTDRLRNFLSAKIGERADIEIKYIKQLYNWINGLTPPVEDPDMGTDSYLDNDVVRRILNCMRQEALQTVEARQTSYMQIMSHEGPYSNLKNVALLTQGGPTYIVGIEEEFTAVNNLIKDIEKERTEHNEMKERLQNIIGDLDHKFSRLPRIIAARRPSPSRPTPKLDKLRHRLSSFRRYSVDEDENIAILEKMQNEIYADPAKAFDKMDSRLQEIDANRMHLLLDEMKTYLNYIQNGTHQGSELPDNEIQRYQQELESVKDLLEDNWTGVQENAKRLGTGDSRKLTALFEASVFRTKTGQENNKKNKLPRESNSANSPGRATRKWHNSKKAESETSVNKNEYEAPGYSGDRPMYAKSRVRRMESLEELIEQSSAQKKRGFLSGWIRGHLPRRRTRNK